MYKVYTFIFLCAFLLPIGMQAQENKKPASKTSEVIVIDENNERVIVGFKNARVEVNERNDTVAKITIGRRKWEFIEDYGSTKVRTVRVNHEDFKGHWAGVQLGFCNYQETDHAGFMDLNSGKSMTVGINFLQYSIGLQKHKTNLGLVTGMGWAVYNYRFDSNYLIQKNEEGITVGVPIADRNVKKNKIVASFINVPLLLELQSCEAGRQDAFISAGIYGGLKLGSHTKTVYEGNDKHKSRHDINLNPFQYGLMFQMGINWIKLYGTYNLSTLYEADKGPEVTPFTVGLTLVNF
ncbi:Outer membrane protein beta-barrel domain-containing protein [Saccharicrinis carchari]|uniref:Outer membrane protein beta-barrel domain-containing protein n=1 Tax=Saccharicrinis carchari TaxID=1168039 RepID=A0A521CLL4_SACCC|nr:outer membrane beta-barrel protein [Saccharicrinis carchari]SMO60343.1 Outer membrane protein beta-barrel domain-containing protein [Saccharicrinis carchari]